MAAFFKKEHQAIAAELDGLLRIALTKRTPELRLAFGRALHKAFSDVVSTFRGYSTVGLEWTAGREDVVAEVLGNASAFFESLVNTISAPDIVNRPALLAMIAPEKRLQFVRLAINTRSPLRKIVIQDALLDLGLTSSQIQQFMLTLFEQYAEDPNHPVWTELWRTCKLQLTWGALWEYLSADEVRRIFLAVAKACPAMLISSESRRICSLLSHRLTAEVIDEIVETAITCMVMGECSAQWRAEAAYAPGMLGNMSYKKHLAGVWSAESVLWLASTSPHEMHLSTYDASQLLDGLEYVYRKLPAFRDRQFDCWPLLRMHRWCLEALFVLGYVEAPLEKEVDEHGKVECVAYCEGRRYVALNQCSELAAGTLVLFPSGTAEDAVLFNVVPEM